MTRYTVEKSREHWLISVSGISFFRCKDRRDAVRTARLASELLQDATMHPAPQFIPAAEIQPHHSVRIEPYPCEEACDLEADR
jgi:hypothetical protein